MLGWYGAQIVANQEPAMQALGFLGFGGSGSSGCGLDGRDFYWLWEGFLNFRNLLHFCIAAHFLDFV